VDNQIANLSVVKAPYSGTVRRIKWKGLAPDGSLSAEITLMVSNSDLAGSEALRDRLSSTLSDEQ
jgi:hypothetical protein